MRCVTGFEDGEIGRVRFNKTSGVVVNDRLEVSGRVVWDRSHQLGDQITVMIESRGFLAVSGSHSYINLVGHDETITHLILENASWADPTRNTSVEAFGGSLTVLGSITAVNNSPMAIPHIRCPLLLPPGLRPLHVSGANAYGLDISELIGGAGGFSKQGPGIVLLQTNNTFTGNVNVSAGLVEARHPLAFGGTNSGVSLNGGGVILRDVAITNETLFVNSPGSALTSIGTCAWTGPIVLQHLLDMSSGATLTLSGPISGDGGLSLFGDTIEFAGSQANSYTGETLVRCELLRLNKPATGTAYAFSGPLTIGGGAAPQHEVRWLNNSQINRSTSSVALFSNGVMNLNTRNDTVGTLSFTGGRVTNTIAGTLTLHGAITANAAASVARIDANLALAASPSLFMVGNGAATPDLMVNSVLSETGGLIGITKQGSGELWLNGVNTYTGSTLIEAGILRAQNAAALGTAGNGTVVSDGASLEVGAGLNLNEPLTLAGTGPGGTHGALHLEAAANVSANIALTAPASVRVNSSFSTLSGVISGTGPLTKLGAGSLQLGGGAGSANTYSGDTVVDEGLLVLFKPAGVAAVPGHLIIGRGGIGSPAATARNFNSDMVVGSVTVRRGGLYDLNNQNEGFSLANLGGQPPLTLIEGGSVQTGTGTLTLPGGTDLAVFVNPGTGALGGLTSTINGRLSLLNGTHTFYTGADGITFGSDPALNIPAQVLNGGGNNAIVKSGPGSMRLAGNNTFNGLLTVNEGRVIAGSSQAFGNALASTFIASNAVVALEGGLTIPEALLNSSSAQPAIRLLDGNTTVSGVIQLNVDTHLSVDSPGSTLTHLDTMTGFGRLIKTGPGRLNFTNNLANTYSGDTVVLGGMLDVNKSGVRGIPGNVIIGDPVNPPTNAILRLTTLGQIPPTATVQVNRSGLFQSAMPAATDLTIGALTGAGLVAIGGGSALSISNETAIEFAGTLLPSTSPLNKRGFGTLRLTGNSPAYQGTLNVINGTLKVDGRLTNAPVIISGSATLAGDGAVGNVGPASVVPLFRPDTGTPARRGGDLEVGNIFFGQFGYLFSTFYGPSESGGNDAIIARGTVGTSIFTDSQFQPTFAYPPREGDVITVIRKDSAGAISGTFQDWPEGITRQVGHVTVRASYLGGDGNDFTLTVTNVPLAATGYRLEEGNGNQTVEPDECNLLYVSLVNRRTNSVTVTNALLRALTPGVFVTIPQAKYPALPAGAAHENLTPFQFRTDPALPCGSPVEFELVFGIAGEGPFALTFSPVSGTDCEHVTGPCESCIVVAGQFTTETPVSANRLLFTGGPSICDPPKLCPGVASEPTRLLQHHFTNSTTNDLCVTALLQFNCPPAPTNALGVAAYLGAFNPEDPCAGYLADGGELGPPYPPFSFRVPAGSNFVIVVSARVADLVCDSYAVELFGLPCPPPVLAIAPESDPTQVRVHWSTAYPGWTAQQAGAPTGGFNPVPQTPAIVNGRYALTNLAKTTNQFYRLTQ